MSLASKVAALFGTSGTALDSALLPAGAPAGSMNAFAGSTAPSGWLLSYGQAVSRTTYAALFAVIGTAYGAGDGSTTFNLPDMRGRGAAGKDDMGGAAAGVLNVTLTGTKASTSTGVITGLSSTAGLAVSMKAFGTGIGANAVISSIDSATQVTLSVNSTSTGSTSIRFGIVDAATLGAIGGAQTHALTTPQMPAHSHTGVTASAGAHTHTNAPTLGDTGSGGAQSAMAAGTNNTTNTTSSAGAHSHTLTIDTAGGGAAHPIMQPTIVLNWIIKT